MLCGLATDFNKTNECNRTFDERLQLRVLNQGNHASTPFWAW